MSEVDWTWESRLKRGTKTLLLIALTLSICLTTLLGYIGSNYIDPILGTFWIWLIAILLGVGFFVMEFRFIEKYKINKLGEEMLRDIRYGNARERLNSIDGLKGYALGSIWALKQLDNGVPPLLLDWYVQLALHKYALPGLRIGVMDKDRNIREAALLALEEIGTVEALEIVLETEVVRVSLEKPNVHVDSLSPEAAFRSHSSICEFLSSREILRYLMEDETD